MPRFNVTIEETLKRNVIIEAEDEFDAHERAEELCSEGRIDLDYKDFDTRTCTVYGEADEIEESYKEVYAQEIWMNVLNIKL